MFGRGLAEAVFAEAVAACDPSARVLTALADVPAGDRRLGIAVGKAALAMARGAGPVAHGVAIAPVDDGGALPAGWRVLIAPHPVPDQRSVEAAEAAWRIADREARAGDVLLVLISGGASALLEAPRDGVTLDELRTTVAALMAAGAPIAELNLVRSALSRIKAGGLIAHCPTRVVTLAISDVIGDDLATIGSGPTIAPAAPLSPRAAEVLRRHGVAVPRVLATSETSRPPRIGDMARVIAPMTAFAEAAITSLAARGIHATRLDPPIVGEVHRVAAALAALGIHATRLDPPIADDDPIVAAAPGPHVGLVVAWGEPTLAVPAEHGEGGRAQQLALELARTLRGTHRAAFCIGSDGTDGPAPKHRPVPAGAFVDGGTWDAIIAAGLDPDAALVRRDAGSAFAAVVALVVTGPTGINHADLVILG